MVLTELALIITVLSVITGPGAAFGGVSIVQLLFTALAPTGLATLLTALYMRRKIKADTGHVDADAVQILTNTSITLLEPLNKQIEFLTKQLEIANKKITELNARLEKYENDHE